jgi:hypothetical protein
MKKIADQIITAKMAKIFDDESGWGKADIEVEKNDKDEVVIVIKRMYEYVTMNLSHLTKVAKLFGTENINDDRYAYGGCETCDYGSSYEIRLHIKPMAVNP